MLRLSDQHHQLLTQYPGLESMPLWWLIAHVTNTPDSEIHTRFEPLSEANLTQLHELLRRHVSNHEPLGYVIGSVPFLELTLTCEQPTLIPRPETEEMTAFIIERLHKHTPEARLHILDVGTGTGAIALSIGASCASTNLIGIDISREAIDLASRNRTLNGINNVMFMLNSVEGHIQTHSHGYDLIVSNPPYISDAEMLTLDPSVLRWEDPRALTAPENGLAFYRFFATQGPLFINRRNKTQSPLPFHLVLEYGHLQRNAITEIFESRGHQIAHYTDMSGKDRWCTVTFMLDEPN